MYTVELEPLEHFMNNADLARKVGVSSQTIREKRKKGWTDEKIIEQAAVRKRLKETGAKNTSDRGSATAGVPQSFYAQRAAEMKVKAGGVAAIESVAVPVPSSPSIPVPVTVPAKGKRPVPDEEMFNAQWRKEIALADLKDLEVAQKRGELVPIVQVQSWVTNCIVRAREVWMGLRDLADRVRQEPDIIKAQQLVDDEVRRGLEELEKFGVLSSGRKVVEE